MPADGGGGQGGVSKRQLWPLGAPPSFDFCGFLVLIRMMKAGSTSHKLVVFDLGVFLHFGNSESILRRVIMVCN